MPLLIPIVAAGLGFGGGLFASDALSKFTRLALVLGVGYVAFKVYGSK
jgi:hypothetical protein